MTLDWHAQCLDYLEDCDLSVLLSPAVVQLEQEIIGHLAHSWCSEEKAKLLFELVVLTRPEVCVEIGGFTGSTSLPLLAGVRYLGQGTVYVVEPWSNEEAVRGLPEDDVNTSWWSGVDMAVARKEFFALLEAWSLEPWCQVIQDTSADAAARLPGAAVIDLLHLDGNFSQDGAALDSELYLPKVSPGGHVVLSNVLATTAGRPTKMRALAPLFDGCEVVCEVDRGNTLLFRKN